MKIALIVAAAVAAFSSAAVAADMPVKAPLALKKLACPLGTGFYAGLNSYAQVANGDVAGTSVIADGAAIGFTLGYGWGDCAGHWYGFEGMFDYQNLGGSSNTPALGISTSLASKWEMTQKFKVGANLADIMTFLPNFGALFPGLPQPAAGTTNPKAYVAGVIREADVSASFLLPSGHVWEIQPGIGLGIQSQTANGSVVDAFADCTFANTGFTAGLPAGQSANLGRVCRAGVGVYY
jgi:hypothetical protein